MWDVNHGRLIEISFTESSSKLLTVKPGKI